MKAAITSLALLLGLAGWQQAAAQANTATQPPAAAPGTDSLSDQLSQSKGVIAPAAPAVDPGIVKVPPATGSKMPVIPPPGTEGGDPNVQPK